MRKKRISAVVSSFLLTASLMSQAFPLEAMAEEFQSEETTLTVADEPVTILGNTPEVPTPSEGSVSDACGETTTWTYDIETKTLYLQGEGEVEDFCWNSETWLDYAPEAENLVIESSITAITAATLSECKNLKSVIIPRLSLSSEGDVSSVSLNEWFGGQDMRKQLVSVTILEVTEIPKEYFKDMNLLESVTLPDTVETIGESAFSGCTALQAVPVSAGLKTIASSAFKNCSTLTEITLPEGAETIGEKAFDGCTGVLALNLPDSLKTVESYAFNGMSELKELVIPPNVENLGISLIGAANSLGAITLPFALDPKDTQGEGYVTQLDSYILSHGETMPLKKVTITGGTTIPNSFMNGHSDVTEVNLPDSITLICKNAFYNCSGLTEIHLPANLEIIREGAFRGCTGITELTLPENIKRIESTAFYGMNEVTELTIPDSAEYIGTDLFGNDSKMQKITLPFAGESRDATLENGCNLVSTIGYSSSNREMPLTEITFTGGTIVPNGYFHYFENLKTVNFADTMTELGNNLFYATGAYYGFQNAALESIILPDSIISIGNDTFRNCPNLANITFSENLREIGERAFTDTAWLNAQTAKGFINAGNVVIGYNGDYKESLTIPEGTIGIGAKAFQSGTFSTVTLPDGLLYIGRVAFDSCRNLKEVNIPDSVEEIDDYAFYRCSSLETVTIPATVGTIGTDVFSESSWSNLQEDGPIYIGTKFYGYKGTMPAHTTLTLRDGTDTIVDDALSGYANLDEIILPDSLKTIGKNAFKGCISLTEISIPDSVTDIGDNAFNGCTELTQVQLSANLNKIGSYAFKECAKLEKADIPYGTKSIGGSAFYNCGALREVILPDTLETVESYVFGFSNDFIKEDDFARTLTIAEGSEKVTYTMTKELSFCTNKVNLPEGITTICESAFEKYTLVDEIILPSTVTTAEKRAFYNLENLKTIGNQAVFSEIGEEAFRNTSIEETPAMTPDCVLNKLSFGYCKSLKKALLPENIETIPRELFSNCYAIPEIVIPDSVTQIDYYAFGNNISLKTITVPNQIEDEEAMSGVIVTKDTINSAFLYDKSLLDGQTLERTIIFAEGRKTLSSALMNNFRNEAVSVVLPKSLKKIEGETFASCPVLTSLTIPDNVTEIGTSLCWNSKALKEVKLSKNLTIIPQDTFRGCEALETVEIPDGVTEIGNNAFSNCHSLKTMVLPDSVTTVGAEVFAECISLKSLKLSENLTEIGRSFCHACVKLKSISIPDSVTEIGWYAFYDCISLTKIEVSDNITDAPLAFGFEYDDMIYRDVTVREGSQTVPKAIVDALKSTMRTLTLPEGVTYLSDYALDGCKVLQSVTLPDSLKTIGVGAFRNTGISELIIPDGVTTLSKSMCEKCSNLRYVKFSEAVSIIPDLTFADCDNLSKVDTVRTAYSFRHNSSFKNCVSLYDSRFSVLNRNSIDFSASKTEVQPNGFVNLSVHYSFNDGVADKNTSKVKIVLPKGVTAVETSLNDGEYDANSNIITLNNTGNNVTRTFTVKFADSAESYRLSAVLSATIEGESVEETIGVLDISALELSIKAPETVNHLNDIKISGVSTPGSTVTIYADGEKVGTAEANKSNGRYYTLISLPSKDETTYSLTAKSGDSETETVTLTYTSGVPEIEQVTIGYWAHGRFSSYYLMHYRDLTECFTSGKDSPVMTFNQGYPLQFDIVLDNPYNAQMVFVTSTKGDETYSMRANWIPEEGVYRAEGYFNPNNTSYIPGTLGIEIAKAAPMQYNTADNVYYGSAESCDIFTQEIEDGQTLSEIISNSEDVFGSEYTEATHGNMIMQTFDILNDGEAEKLITYENEFDYFYRGTDKVYLDEAMHNPEEYGFVRSEYTEYDPETGAVTEFYERYIRPEEATLMYLEYVSENGLEEYMLDADQLIAMTTSMATLKFGITIEDASTTQVQPTQTKNAPHRLTVSPVQTVVSKMAESGEFKEQKAKWKEQHSYQVDFTPIVNRAKEVFSPTYESTSQKPTAQKVVKAEKAVLTAVSIANNKTVETAVNTLSTGKVSEVAETIVGSTVKNAIVNTLEKVNGKIPASVETVSKGANIGGGILTFVNGLIESKKVTDDSIAREYTGASDHDYYSRALESQARIADIRNHMAGEARVFVSGVSLAVSTSLALGKAFGVLKIAGWPAFLIGVDTFLVAHVLDHGLKLIQENQRWNKILAAEEDKVKQNQARLDARRALLESIKKELGLSDSEEDHEKLYDEYQKRIKDLGWVDPKFIYDPSGYVYEAVETNPLTGATMTVYYQDPETGEEIEWNATDYDQMNPLITDEFGAYAWDVPEGLWRVKFELEGYETMYSDWMDVPPIRTEVNFNAISLAEPQLLSTVEADGKIILVFTKYMDNSTLTPETVKILSDGKEIAVKITPASGSDSYANTYVIEPETGTFPAGTLTVSLSENCKSYSGVAVKAVTADAERPDTIISLTIDGEQIASAGTETEITLHAMPASVAYGKKVTFSDASGITTMKEQAMFDENGTAVIQLEANKTGTASLTFGIEDTDLTADYALAVISSDIYEIYEENLPEETQEEPVMYGDANGDNIVNLKDAVLIRRYIAGGWEAEIDEKAADVNHDGVINLKDVVLIRRYIVGGWDVEF